MLKQLLNECTIVLKIIPQGPILVKGLDEEKDKSVAASEVPDMKFILIHRNGRNEPYLPGGSLKGVMRSLAEKIARSLASPFGCCNPFWVYRDEGPHDELSCSNKLEITSAKRTLTSYEIYRRSCPICKLFGNSALGSRFAITDAYLPTNCSFSRSYRDGVAIDRFTGGAKAGAKFRYEVLEHGSFVTYIRIMNFELWQLGLVAYLLKDMTDKIIRIGFGKRRGLGKVRGEVSSIDISYLGTSRPTWAKGSESLELWSIGKQLNSMSMDYDFQSEVACIELESPYEPATESLGLRMTLRTNLEPFYNATTEFWNDYIESYSLPEEMTGKKIEELREEG